VVCEVEEGGGGGGWGGGAAFGVGRMKALFALEMSVLLRLVGLASLGT
jgi:hypothetical protein